MHLPSSTWAAAVVAALLPTTCGLLAGAAPSPAPQNETPTYRADTRLVVLQATVVDKNGKLISNLPREAFKVYENGVEQKLKIFRREDIPISLGIVIDNSGSMRDKRAKVEAASIALVKASNPRDEVFIVNFNDDAYEDVPFTSDVKKMEEGIARIDSRGGTAMRDAVSLSIDNCKEKGKKDKKVVLVITDGNDNTSSLTLEKLVQKAHNSEVLIYAIGLLNEEERRERKKAERALNEITVASGGYAYYPKDVTEVERIALQIAHEIRNQYVLAYSPENQQLDGTFRQIKVTASGPGRPTVRTRSGYYATPDQGTPRKATASQAPPASGK